MNDTPFAVETSGLTAADESINLSAAAPIRAEVLKLRKRRGLVATVTARAAPPGRGRITRHPLRSTIASNCRPVRIESAPILSRRR